MHFHKRGGLERAAVELSRHLADRGHEITVYSSTVDGSDLGTMKHVCVPSLSSFGSAAHLSFRRSSATLLRHADADIIHAHGTEAGYRDIVTFQSCHRAGVELRRRLGEKVKGFGISDPIRLRTEAATLKQGAYKKIIAVSEGLKRELIQWYNVPEKDIVVIPNGVNLEEFSPPTKSERDKLRTNLGLQPNDIALIFLANEFDRKGLRFVIEALSIISESNVKLIVAGKDHPAPYLELANRFGVGKLVIFRGATGAPAGLLKAADIFLMPTFHESFLMAGIEAAACGLPLLITRVPGVEDYLVDGENGYFIERSADSIAEKIRLLLDPHRRAAMGSGANTTAQNYSWDAIATATEQVYHEVVNRKGIV